MFSIRFGVPYQSMGFVPRAWSRIVVAYVTHQMVTITLLLPCTMIILGQCQINESFPLTLLSNRMSGHNVGFVLVVPYGPIERPNK